MTRREGLLLSLLCLFSKVRFGHQMLANNWCATCEQGVSVLIVAYSYNMLERKCQRAHCIGSIRLIDCLQMPIFSAEIGQNDQNIIGQYGF